MKANFKTKKTNNVQNDTSSKEKSELTPEEFEEFVSKSGAAGSFMIFRSSKKDEELGIDEL